MKKLFLIIPALLLASMSIMAQKSTNASDNEATTKATGTPTKMDTPPVEKVSDGAPKFKFKEILHDFGNVKQNNPASFTFEFTNTGDAPVLLESVQASCNCTTPEWTKEPVAPGKTGKITATFNSLSPGNFSKTITVKFPSGEIEYLTIKGFVVEAPVIPASPVEVPKSN